jgi:TPR repeat protein
LRKAIEYYSLAIRSGDKVDSAIKDLAAVLHQTGSTKQAV